MSSSSSSFTAYMKQKVPVSCWDRFWQLFVVFFLICLAASNVGWPIFDHPAEALLFALAALMLALLMSAASYWKDRYGPRFERAYIVFLAVVILVLLTVIVRHEIEKHRRNLQMSSGSTSQASTEASGQRPTTND